jgi:hypothetical protein
MPTRTPDTTKVACQVPTPVMQMLQELAKETRLTVAWHVRKALIEYLQRERHPDRRVGVGRRASDKLRQG